MKSPLSLGGAGTQFIRVHLADGLDNAAPEHDVSENGIDWDASDAELTDFTRTSTEKMYAP